MQKTTKFPLLSGNLSIDLVNTEVVRRGQRLDLLTHDTDILDWLHSVHEQIPFWPDTQVHIKQQLPSIKASLLKMRQALRSQFEAIADQQSVPVSFITYLEQLIEQAPFTYKLKGDQLVAIPLGNVAEMLLAIIALDVLKLIVNGKLQRLKRCANTDCVLLFIDESGRRKWCSMKICGNRKKVAQFQQRKTEQ